MKIDPAILENAKKVTLVLAEPTQVAHRALVIQKVCELESDLCSKIADFFIQRNSSLMKDQIMDDLYYESGMLSSLNKISKIAYYLGFISNDLYHDFIKLAKLRNRYAHDKHRRQLDEEPELVKFIQDTYLFRQNKNDLDGLRWQNIFLAINEQLSRKIEEIN